MDSSAVKNYDIIGDVHGFAYALENLLEKLGYKEGENGYQYAGTDGSRQAIFVGDLVDRGNDIRRTVNIVRAMVDNGSAQMVMGNHEFNAIAYFTPVANGFLRQHNKRSNKQIKATVDQFSDYQDEWQSHIEWFKQLPLFLDLGHFRVVHACWDSQLIEQLQSRHQTQIINDVFLMEAEDSSSFAGQLIERLTRGISLRLPKGQLLMGRDGYYRHSFRVNFWSKKTDIYDDIVFQPDPLPEDMQQQVLTKEEKLQLVFYSENEKPLFIGHYWLGGEPMLVSKNIACLDYSAVNGGKLVAYNFNVDKELAVGKLDNKNFVYVDCESKK